MRKCQRCGDHYQESEDGHDILISAHSGYAKENDWRHENVALVVCPDCDAEFVTWMDFDPRERATKP
jgi:hypothetical protein